MQRGAAIELDGTPPSLAASCMLQQNANEGSNCNSFMQVLQDLLYVLL